jgi:predicted DNA-binding transcriptional regulator YafY
MTDRIWIDYTNYRGERAWREISPLSMFFGSNEWHPERQWFLSAIDIEKGQGRTFAMKDIHAWQTAAPVETVGRTFSAPDEETQMRLAIDQSKPIDHSPLTYRWMLAGVQKQRNEAQLRCEELEKLALTAADREAIREALKEAQILISFHSSATAKFVDGKITAALALIGEG